MCIAYGVNFSLIKLNVNSGLLYRVLRVGTAHRSIDNEALIPQAADTAYTVPNGRAPVSIMPRAERAGWLADQHFDSVVAGSGLENSGK